MLQPQERIALSTREDLAVCHSITEDARYGSEERPLFYAVSNRPKRNGIDVLKRITFCRAIGHDAGEFRDFGNPTTILLTAKFDDERC